MRWDYQLWLRCAVWIVLIYLGLWTATAWAAEPAGSTPAAYETQFSRFIHFFKTNFTRGTWDVLMKWFNFLLLVTILIKYAKAPIVAFLKGEQTEIARSIASIDEKKRSAEEKIKAGQLQLKASEERLKLIKDRIISEGQRQKEKIIASARQESRIMLASARTKIDSQVRDAYQLVRTELVETAVDNAMAKLPSMMTDSDHEGMIALWFENTEQYNVLS